MTPLLLARDACIRDPVVLVLIALGNAGIALAYIWIPISIYRVLISLPNPPQPLLFRLFISFILSCGSTHACAVLVLFRPAWYLEAALCLATAVVSLVTALILHRLVPALREMFYLSGRLSAETRA